MSIDIVFEAHALSEDNERGIVTACLPGCLSARGRAGRVHRRAVHHDGSRHPANTAYTVWQDADDLRKLRGKQLVDIPGRAQRFHVPTRAAGSIAALLTLRDQIIGPIVAGVRSPRMGRKPAAWSAIDRDDEQIRIGMQISSPTSASPHQPPHRRQHFVDRRSVSG